MLGLVIRRVTASGDSSTISTATSHGNSNDLPISVLHKSSTTASSGHDPYVYTPRRDHSTIPTGLMHNAV